MSKLLQPGHGPSDRHHRRQKKEVHLCQACEQENILIKDKELNLPAILQAMIGQHVGRQTDELARLTCPACGIKYMEFRAEGRWAVRTITTSFAPAWTALAADSSRRPARRQGAAQRAATPPGAGRVRRTAQTTLRTAVEAEAYEEAARLRDLIRQKEATDESG